MGKTLIEQWVHVPEEEVGEHTIMFGVDAEGAVHHRGYIALDHLAVLEPLLAAEAERIVEEGGSYEVLEACRGLLHTSREARS